jgi:hypothetical protein
VRTNLMSVCPSMHSVTKLTDKNTGINVSRYVNYTGKAVTKDSTSFAPFKNEISHRAHAQEIA